MTCKGLVFVTLVNRVVEPLPSGHAWRINTPLLTRVDPTGCVFLLQVHP